jgi:hypothetical protein
MTAVDGRFSAHDIMEEHVIRLFHRVRSEFLEMPGLRLAPMQAARLLAIDVRLSERILNRLVAEGFLCKTRDGAYLRVSVV